MAMANHHPSNDFLMEHAAGTLPVAQAACISAHMNYCDRCRRAHDQMQNIGGVMLERLQPVPVAESVLEAVLARLNDPEPLRHQTSKAAVALPALLSRIINGDFSQLVWKRITRSLSISYLSTGDSNYEFALYRIAAGGRIPEHRHSGSEMTLVLEGGFSDSKGSYHPGDFIYRVADEKHAPVALDGEDCICLAVLDAPLRFTGWNYRWLNPFLQLRAS
ncbi:MAG: ChrR family anti-sigma-E factor [Proteobacteria bacterium]|nr:ChrR family anti-sigma-E factor [Pseudomonadota bacterium]